MVMTDHTCNNWLASEIIGVVRERTSLKMTLTVREKTKDMKK